MTTHLSCDGFAEALSDLLERDLPESMRIAMETHAAACDGCGPLLADLRRLRSEVSHLPELAPSHDLWSGIAARIETPVVELAPAKLPSTHGDEGTRLRRSVWVRRASLGLAAAGLVAVTATVTHEITKRSMVASTAVAALPTALHDTTASSALTTTGTRAPSAVAAVTPATRAPDSTLTAKSSRSAAGAMPVRTTLAANHKQASARQTYDREIASLRAVLAYRRKDLDSATVAVVDKNLRIIDDAIAQCQQALKKDPQSRFLLESLNDALDEKVQLLRTAATLPSRS